MKLISSTTFFFAATTDASILSRPVWGAIGGKIVCPHNVPRCTLDCGEDRCRWDSLFCEHYCEFFGQVPSLQDQELEPSPQGDGCTCTVLSEEDSSCKMNGCPVDQSCYENDEGDFTCHEDYAPTSLPGWWDMVSANFEGERLKRCFKRAGVAPKEGVRCASTPKTCFLEIKRVPPAAHCSQRNAVTATVETVDKRGRARILDVSIPLHRHI